MIHRLLHSLLSLVVYEFVRCFRRASSACHGHHRADVERGRWPTCREDPVLSPTASTLLNG